MLADRPNLDDRRFPSFLRMQQPALAYLNAITMETRCLVIEAVHTGHTQRAAVALAATETRARGSLFND